MQFLLLLIVGVVIGALGALLSLHGVRKKDVGHEQAFKEFKCLINKGQHEILIATDLDPDCFNNHEFLDSLSQAKDRGCDIRILYDKRASLEGVPELAKLQKKGVVTIKKGEQEMDMHFAVIDGIHIRLDRHPFQQLGRTEAEGRVLTRTFELGRKYRHRFDQMWIS